MRSSEAKALFGVKVLDLCGVTIHDHLAIGREGMPGFRAWGCRRSAFDHRRDARRAIIVGRYRLGVTP